MTLEEGKHGSDATSPADQPIMANVDPRLFHQLLLQQPNFVMRHASQMRDRAEDEPERRSSSMQRTPSQEPRKPTSPSLFSHKLQEPLRNATPIQTGQYHPISSCSPDQANSRLSDSATYSDDRNISDSPLDFSTKKPKFETGRKSVHSAEDLESPGSKLRNILNMKPNDLALNLSKESAHSSPASGNGWNSTPSRSSSSNNSSSPSPTMMDTQSMSPSPRSPSTPASQHSAVISTSGVNSMGFTPYGIFSPNQNLSPIMSQGLPGAGLPLGFDPNPSMFSHVTAGSTLPFGNTLPLSQTNSTPAGNGSAKPRVTRPFKAYPKDPMSFPTMGLYGIPLVPPPGVTEALVHQQSNHAYAEFRQQMLSQTQSKSKRGDQKTTPPNGPLSDSTTSSTNPMNYGLGLIDHGATSAGADGYLSASDDGYSSVAKNRVIKSEDQLKDEAYWERRRKNNEAAKRSRDARRAKEDEIAIRASFLEQENLKLRFEVCALKNETAKLRCMLYKPQQ